MVKIHWTIYIIIGALILFASYRLDEQRFMVFIWVGYLFLAIGVAKLGIGFITGKKEGVKEMRMVTRQMHQPPAQQRRLAWHCPRCKTQLQGYENFCTRCGQKINWKTTQKY